MATIFVWAIVLAGSKADEPLWAEWRGPQRSGLSTGDAWPTTLTEASFEQLWRVDLGPSYSGPIVSNEFVFTTATQNERDEIVYAFDRASGEEKWRAEWQGAMTVPFYAAANGSWIRSTPAHDGKRIYVAGMRDVLVCLEIKSGQEVWRIDFMEEFDHELPSFGLVSSPLVDADAVYIQGGGGVIKINKLTGEILWRVLRDDPRESDSAFSSPIIATISGKRQLVVQTRQELAGVDLESGEVLWRQTVPAYRGMNIQTPVVVEDAIFTSSYQNRSWLYQIDRMEDSFRVSTRWDNAAQGYMSSPIAIGGHVYMHLQNGRFTCVNLANGERSWTSQPFGKYASLVARGNQILALISDGRLCLIDASPAKFALLGEVRLTDQETWAHLAVDGDEFYVRELNALSAYRWK